MKTENKKSKASKPYMVFEDELSMVNEAAAGIHATKFFDLTSMFHLKKEQLADLFHVSLKSLMRYKESKQKLNPAQSEQVLKLMALHNKGIHVFGDDDSFHRWLEKPSYGLGNVKPVKMMNTSGGIDLIINELKRIEWGDLA